MSYRKISIKINDRESVSIPVEQLLGGNVYAQDLLEIPHPDTVQGCMLVLRSDLEYILGEYAGHKVLVPYDPNK